MPGGIIDNITADAPGAKAPATSAAAANGGIIDNLTANLTAPKATATPAATPAPTGPIGVTPVGTTGAFTKFLGLNNLTAPAPAAPKTSVSTPAVTAPQVTGKQGLVTKVADQTASDVGDDLKLAVTGQGDSAASDFLENTNYIKQAAAGMNADPKTAQAAQVILPKLADLSSVAQGASGGILKPINTGQPDTAVDTGIKFIGKALGGLPTIEGIGELAPSAIAPTLSSYLEKNPLTAKYLLPYVGKFVSLATGLAGYSQLDPDLGTDITARFKAAASAVATAPIYLALGEIGSPALRIPASGILGYGMAKLSGASNKDAIQNGVLFATMDAVTTAMGSRGETDQETQSKKDDAIAQINSEALSILNKYSDDVKLTKNSTPAQVDAVYNRAVHQASPKVGGTAQDLESVKSAYDIVSKGAVSNTQGKTAPEQSVDVLHNETKRIVAKNGHGAAVETLKDSLGLDHDTATRIADAATVAHTPGDIKDAIQADIQSKMDAKAKEETSKSTYTIATDRAQGKAPAQADVEKVYYNEKIRPNLKEGRTAVLDPDDVRKYFNDYSEENRPMYSKANKAMLDRALVEHPGKNFAIVGGGSGSGKSEFLTKSLVDEKYNGVVYDATQSDPNFTMKVIEQAKAAGKTPEAYFMISDPSEARFWTMVREAETGREVKHDAFVNIHSSYPKTILRLAEEGVDIHAIDARGLSGEQITEKVANKDFEKDPVDTVNKMDYTEANVKARTLYTEKEYAKSKDNVNGTEPKILSDSSQEHDNTLSKSGSSESGNGEKDRSEIQPAEGSASGSKNPSKIGKSIEAKAIEAGLTKGFPETAGYDATTFKEQAEKAAELFDSGIDNARAVIRGDQPLPEGLKGEAVIAAAEEYLIQHPNAEMAEELANSPLVTANSESAQGLSLSRMRQPDSATAKLQKLKQDKIDAAGGTKEVAKARAKAKAATSKVLLPKEELSWDSFIDGITC